MKERIAPLLLWAAVVVGIGENLHGQISGTSVNHRTFTLTKANVVSDSEDELVSAVEYGLTTRSVALWVHKRAGGKFQRLAAERIPDASAAGFTVGNYDRDSEDEVAVTVIDGDGELAVLLYDYDQSTRKLVRFGDERLTGVTSPSAASGDFANDLQDELAVCGLDGGGRVAVLLFDHAPGSTDLRRIADFRLPGASEVSVVAADLDDDPRDEIVLSTRDAAGQVTIQLYDYDELNKKLNPIGKAQLSASDVSVVAVDLDSDPKHEIVLSMMDDQGRVAALVYDYDATSKRLNRTAALRLAGRSGPSIAAAGFGGGPGDEVVLSMRNAEGRVAIELYRYDPGNRKLNPIGDLQLVGQPGAFAVGADLDNDPWDELALGMIDGEGRPTILAYDLRRPSGSPVRIADTRVEARELEVRVTLTKIVVIDEADGSGSAEPYLWPFFFKIDEGLLDPNTLFDSRLWSHAPGGEHGNLGKDFRAGQERAVPSRYGQWLTRAEQNVVYFPAGNVYVGAIIALLEEDNIPSSNAVINEYYPKFKNKATTRLQCVFMDNVRKTLDKLKSESDPRVGLVEPLYKQMRVRGRKLNCPQKAAQGEPTGAQGFGDFVADAEKALQEDLLDELRWRWWDVFIFPGLSKALLDDFIGAKIFLWSWRSLSKNPVQVLPIEWNPNTGSNDGAYRLLVKVETSPVF